MKTSLERLIDEALGLGDYQPVRGTPPIGVIPQPVSWPFRTVSAQKVWKVCQEIMAEFPHIDNKHTLYMAIEKSEVPALELTPEDWRLLEMAIEAQRSTQRWMRPATGDLGDELPKL